MDLTRSEKAAGRAFRDAQSADLLARHTADPPTYTAPNFLALFRHNCPGRRGVSSAIELKEVYVLSPAYAVYTDQTGEQRVALSTETIEPGDPEPELVPAGRFGFIYRSGKCRAVGCGATARSRAGRLVDAWERPPAEGRVARAGA